MLYVRKHYTLILQAIADGKFDSLGYAQISNIIDLCVDYAEMNGVEPAHEPLFHAAADHLTALMREEAKKLGVLN